MGESSAPSGRISLRMDVIRGLAAFLVVLGHAREKIMYIQDVTFPPVMNFVLAPTGYAQEAVSVFFVLSGYLVGGSVLRDTRAMRFNWYTYFCKRVSRLWVVLLPGLLLTAGLDAITKTVEPQRFVIAAEGSNNEWTTALCNAFFLSPGWCRPYGTNASLWSLAFEFWFYVVFAAVVSAGVTPIRQPVRWVGALVLLATGIVALGPTFLVYSISWLMGVVVYEIARRRARDSVPGLTYIMVLGLLLATMTATSLWQIDRGLQMVAVGLVTSVLLLLIVSETDGSGAESHRSLRLVGRLGPWSYSLYVYHLPILTVAVALTPNGLYRISSAVAAIVIYAIAFLSAVVSWLFSLITERHTAVVRSTLLGLRGRFAGTAKGRG